jgi:hypothetical protein
VSTISNQRFNHVQNGHILTFARPLETELDDPPESITGRNDWTEKRECVSLFAFNPSIGRHGGESFDIPSDSQTDLRMLLRYAQRKSNCRNGWLIIIIQRRVVIITPRTFVEHVPQIYTLLIICNDMRTTFKTSKVGMSLLCPGTVPVLS